MLNWLTRYAVLVEDLGPGRPSVLDIGCGPVGLSSMLADLPFVGQDIEFPARVPATMFAVRTAPGPFPWRDRAFDTISCVDTLEHMPRDVRGAFVVECARVAARRVFISCPIAEAADRDAMFRQMYAAAGLDAPEWLDEHDEHGLPTAAEVAAACAHAEGFTVEPWAQVNGMLSTLAVVADVHPELAADAVVEYRDHREQWLHTLRESRFGPAVRAGFVLTRDAPATPIVDVDDFARVGRARPVLPGLRRRTLERWTGPCAARRAPSSSSRTRPAHSTCAPPPRPETLAAALAALTAVCHPGAAVISTTTSSIIPIRTPEPHHAADA